MVMVDYSHKIAVPQRQPFLVSRPRLTAIVDAIREQRLLVLTAPAGYGKTSLLVDWAATAVLPVCWFSLDPLDNDGRTFLSYVLASIRQRFPTALSATHNLLYGDSRSPYATLCASLIREIAAIAHDFVLVFDDWHLVEKADDCVKLVGHILQYCPRCHVTLASRTTPGVPNTMLLAGRRQAFGLDEDSLRFTPDELLAVLADARSGPLPPDVAQRWIEQTNGWITGILLALEVGPTVPPADALTDPRAQRRIYTFLAEQVLERQTPELRAFLLDAALLDEIDPDTCDELRGRSDSAVLLADALHAHVFVSEIRHAVARFHSLFREFLLERYETLQPSRFRAMARRAGDIHLARNRWPAAFEWYVKASDRAAAQRAVAAGGEAIYMDGRLDTLERWFAELWLDDLATPLLCLKARVRLDRGDRQKAELLLQLAATRASGDEFAAVVLLQAQIKRLNGEYDAAIGLAQTVLRSGATDKQQASARRTIAICQQRLGKLPLAVREMSHALDIERRRGDLYTAAQLQHGLGILHEELGLLQHAEQMYALADEHWAGTGNIGHRAMTLNSKGVLQHLSGNYQEAHATLLAAAKLAQEAAIPLYQSTVLASLGDLYSDLQLWQPARDAYHEARQRGGTSYVMRYVDYAGIRLMLRQRRYADALHALDAIAPSDEMERAQALLLRSGIASRQSDYFAARENADAAIALFEQAGKKMDQARALLAVADAVAHDTPEDGSGLRLILDRAAHIADELGHDWFLVGSAIHLPEMMRRAAAAGWKRAPDWLERQHEIRVVARMIDQQDRRPLLTIRALGTDQILVDGKPITLGWSKAREVLCYLLEHPDNTTPDTLRTAIWPEGAPSRIVKDAMYALRSALPADLIFLQGRQFYRLDREIARVEYDVDSFLELLKRTPSDTEALLSAIDLYGGPYLPTCDSEWCSSLRGRLEAAFVNALHRAAEVSEHNGRFTDALGMFRRILEQEPFDEIAHAGTMRCYLELGNRAAAIEHYRAFRSQMYDELGIELERSSEIEMLYARILNTV